MSWASASEGEMVIAYYIWSSIRCGVNLLYRIDLDSYAAYNVYKLQVKMGRWVKISPCVLKIYVYISFKVVYKLSLIQVFKYYKILKLGNLSLN